MPGNALHTNEELKTDKSLRWRNLCIDFDLCDKFASRLRRHRFRWSKPMRFNSHNKRHVPSDQAGIYIFFVKPNFQFFSEQSFIMYIGYTMNLKSRYDDYLKYKNSDEPNLLYKRMMLNIWEETLYYSFASLNKAREEVKQIETEMISSVVPPINKEFLDAYVKQQVDLYRKR